MADEQAVTLMNMIKDALLRSLPEDTPSDVILDAMRAVLDVLNEQHLVGGRRT